MTGYARRASWNTYKGMIEAKKIRVLEKFNSPGFGGRELLRWYEN